MLNLNSQPLFVFLLSGFLAANTGCSANVKVERARTAAAHGSGNPTPPNSPEPRSNSTSRPRPSQPTPPTEPPPQPTSPPVNRPTISGNTFIFSYRGGDTYTHSETHVQIQQSPVQRIEERIVIHTVPDRQMSEECERLAREHRQRVKKWREFPGAMGQ